jgi:predicted RNase H-like nuclease (RuvC/YqgF family)
MMAFVKGKMRMVAGPELRRQSIEIQERKIQKVTKHLANPFNEPLELKRERRRQASIEMLDSLGDGQA